MRRSTETIATLALAVLAGCGGPQVKNPADRPPSATADGALTVVGWSLRDQAPLGVQGALKAEGDRTVATFDTHVSPQLGTTFEHLAAGHYRIEITHRYTADRAVGSGALDEVDVQPGDHVRREVVVDDRDPDLASGAKH